MKLTKPVAISLLATWLCMLSVVALARQQPAELPPASYAGAQYVDSTGCVFVRAGVGATVQWVPRLSRDRQQLCGFMPTFKVRGAQSSQEVAEPNRAVPVAPVVITGAPIASQRAPAPAGAPSLQQGPAVVPAGVVVTPENAASKGVGQTVRVVPRHVHENRRTITTVTVPKGYRKVWKDDRLNPRRAEQNLAGHARSTTIWSNTVPRRRLD